MSSQPGMQMAPHVSMQTLHREWGWFMALGIILILLGIAAIVFPVTASYAIATVLGILLVIGGVVHGIHALTAHQWSGFLWQLLTAVIYLAAGIMLLAYPLGGVITLTLLLGVFLIVAGLVRIGIALTSRPMPNWGWFLFSGILALILGILIWAQLPSSAAWVIGLFVGIDLLFSGWSMTILALAAHRAPPETM